MRATAISPPRAPWGWAIAGLVPGLLCAVLLFAPARWLTAALEGATQGRLLLGDARGTVWDGSAQLMLAGGAGSTGAVALPSRVDWHLRPRWNGAAAEISSPCCTTQPHALRLLPRWGGSRVAVGDSRTDIATAQLAAEAVQADPNNARWHLPYVQNVSLPAVVRQAFDGISTPPEELGGPTFL